MVSTLDLGSAGVVVLSDMTISELHDLRTSLEKDLASIKNQIRGAVSRYKRTGVPAKDVWFERINKAKIIKGQQINAINSEVSKRKSLYEKRFIEVAEQKLDPDVFNEIRLTAIGHD